MRKEAQGISSEEMSGQIHFMKDNLLQAISKLRNHVDSHVAAKGSYILGSIVHTANMEIRQIAEIQNRLCFLQPGFYPSLCLYLLADRYEL